MITLPAYGEGSERTLRSHLSLVHGVYVGDVKSEAGLLECHADQHADPDPHFQLRHEHASVPDSLEDVEEWVW